MAGKTPTQDLVDRQLAARNRLAEAAVKLEAVLNRIPGRSDSSGAGALGAPATETGFFPAIGLLTGEFEEAARVIGSFADELDRLL